MSTRKRKPADKNLPTFRVTRYKTESEEDDLKAVKAKLKKELEDSQEKTNDWLDQELEKNLKNIK